VLLALEPKYRGRGMDEKVEYDTYEQELGEGWAVCSKIRRVS